MSGAVHTLPAVGDVWQERDKRFTRYVRVIAIDDGWVNIQTVVPAQDGWGAKPRAQNRWANIDRFDGRYGGYVFHQGGAA